MSHKIQSHSNFQSEVLEAKVPVLVDCWATWCRPNSMISPAIQALATDFTEQIKVGRLNIAEFECLATHYDIRAVPTLLIFNNGQVIEQVIGGVLKATIANKLNELLQGAHSNSSLAVY